MDFTRPTVSINRACEIANVRRRTIYNWMRTGKVEFCYTAGGSPRIYLDTLLVADVGSVRKGVKSE